MTLTSCTNFFYQPSRYQFIEPKLLNINYQNLFIKSADGTLLHGWYFKNHTSEPTKGLFLLLHGNAENISSHFQSLYWVTGRGYDLIAFDYRGYGRSDGDAFPKGVNEDVVEMLNYSFNEIVEKNKYKKFIVYSQSLGGAIFLRAVHDFIKKDKISLAVIESSFVSYKKIAKAKLKSFWVTWPLSFLTGMLISDEFSGEKLLPKLPPVPLLVIHGTNDQIIPYDFGKNLFELASEPKTFWTIEGGRHINAMFADKGMYQNKLIEFIEKLK